MPEWLPALMQTVLKEIGTMILFHPIDLPEEGFQLFTPDQCLQHLSLFRKTIAETRKTLGDDETGKSGKHEAWVNGLCPIAEVMRSGDYFALDTERAQDNDESPIVYLDHEYYFSGWLYPDDVEVVAADIIELVKTVLKDPLQFLDAHWTGGNPYDQWFPESVSFSD